MTTEQKLEQLRKEWVKASGTDRKVIEMRARLLTMVKETTNVVFEVEDKLKRP